MPYPPAAAASPSPTIVRADTSPAWWEILLDVLVALGTVGAVVAALLVANWARKDADRRALDDRKAFAERQEEEREHDRRLADTRWRLSLLEQLIEAFERWQALDQMQLPGGETRVTVEALVRIYRGISPSSRHGSFSEYRLTTFMQRQSNTAPRISARFRISLASNCATNSNRYGRNYCADIVERECRQAVGSFHVPVCWFRVRWQVLAGKEGTARCHTSHTGGAERQTHPGG
jgi:hypothetical protein